MSNKEESRIRGTRAPLSSRCGTKFYLVGPNFILSLKGVWHEIFDFKFFFRESVSPRPPSIPLKPFWIFSKIRGDIRELMFITVVNDTGDKLFSGVNDTSEKNQKA